MKTLIIIIAVSVLSATSALSTDWVCLDSCIRIYGDDPYNKFLCEERCSLEEDIRRSEEMQRERERPHQYDYKCSNDCMRAGYSYGYCSKLCEY